MKTTKLPCGCLKERHQERWVQMCDEHERQWQENHNQAMADYEEGHLQEAA